MSIYIKGMEMPDYGYVCLKVFANGEVLMTKVHRGSLVISGIKDKVGTAIPVPPHGRLIDADALIATHEQVCSRSMKFNLDLAPTVIEAEEGE